MSVSRVSARAFVCVFVLVISPQLSQAQTAAPPPSQRPASSGGTPRGEEHRHPTAPAQDHSQHQHAPTSAFDTRDASGTAWIPATSPMYAIHQERGIWQVMWHGNGFLQYLHDTGERGQSQTGSINWMMGMARRDLGAGRFGVRGMVSLEPLTIRGCGYPDLLATGEFCDGAAIHDRQHPHDFIMEAAAEYSRPIRGAWRWQAYGGLAGEPALGPAAYPHRPSAMPNPLAPISHHWLDATHITFGVVTGAIYNDRWKAEASLFNGREPDEGRWDLDLAPLDSISGRVWLAPSANLALQVSAGRLTEAEPGHDGGPRAHVSRVTASATYHRRTRPDTLFATTAAWGVNREAGESTHALLVEGSVTLDDRDVVFGRIETAGKPSHDLGLHGTDEVFIVGKLQTGYSRYFRSVRGVVPGVGGGISLGLVPRSLVQVYGRRANFGFGIFFTVRPVGHGM